MRRGRVKQRGGYSGGDRGGYGRGGMPGAHQRNGGPVPYDDPMAPKIESTRSEADRVDRVEKLRENIPTSICASAWVTLWFLGDYLRRARVSVI